MANITDIGLTLGITCWIASGFCPKAARTVSVFSRNLWWFHRSGGVDSEGHEFSQSGSDSNKFEVLLMLLGGVMPGDLGLAYSKASPFCEAAACTTSSLGSLGENKGIKNAKMASEASFDVFLAPTPPGFTLQAKVTLSRISSGAKTKTIPSCDTAVRTTSWQPTLLVSSMRQGYYQSVTHWTRWHRWHGV